MVLPAGGLTTGKILKGKFAAALLFLAPIPYSGFYWQTANLAISSFLQIGEDLTWRSLPTSHHTHINIDHTHHEIVIHCIQNFTVGL